MDEKIATAKEPMQLRDRLHDGLVELDKMAEEVVSMSQEIAERLLGNGPEAQKGPEVSPPPALGLRATFIDDRASIRRRLERTMEIEKFILDRL